MLKHSLRLRRQRIGAVGAPLMAAVAVAAIALPSGIAGHSSAGAASNGKLVGGAFDPSYLSIKFGWLPKHTSVTGGSTSPGAETLSAYSSDRAQWLLGAYARDVCQANTADQRFQCLSGVLPLNATPAITGPGPVIAGHKSLWLQGGAPGLQGSPTLAWEYAPHAWALVQHLFGRGQSGAAIVVRIAKGAKFGQHVPLRYASRFTSLPAGWRVLAAYFSAGKHGVGSPPAGVYLAWSYKILKLRTISPATPVEMGNDTSPDVPMLGVFPAFSDSHGCQHTKSKYVTIHGHRFVVTDMKASKHRTLQELSCGDVDGLQVWVSEIGASAHPNWALSPAQVIERLQLLGAKPADWVTNPVP